MTIKAVAVGKDYLMYYSSMDFMRASMAFTPFQQPSA